MPVMRRRAACDIRSVYDSQAAAGAIAFPKILAADGRETRRPQAQATQVDAPTALDALEKIVPELTKYLVDKRRANVWWKTVPAKAVAFIFLIITSAGGFWLWLHDMHFEPKALRDLDSAIYRQVGTSPPDVSKKKDEQ